MKRLIVGSIVGALLVAACTSGQVSSPDATTVTTTTTTSVEQEPKFLRTRMLTPFDACDDLLDWIVPQALELVGPYGLGYGGVPYGEVMFATDAAGGVPRAAAEEDSGTSGAAWQRRDRRIPNQLLLGEAALPG